MLLLVDFETRHEAEVQRDVESKSNADCGVGVILNWLSYPFSFLYHALCIGPPF